MANTQTKSVEELLKDKTYNGFYRYQHLTDELMEALRATREQDGMSIRDIAHCVKKVLDPAEIKSLVKELN